MTIAQAPRPDERFVGSAISATTGEVSPRRPGGKARRSLTIDPTPEGYRHLGRKLQACGDTPAGVLVVLEAPGSYWMSVATCLVHAGVRVRVLHPSHAHHVAKALLKRAKTAAIDAQTLAPLALVLQPAPGRPPPQIYSALPQRLAQRDDLLNLRQQVRHQLHALAQHPAVRKAGRDRMESLLSTLQSQIDEVALAVTAALHQDAAWAAAAERWQSIQGVGGVTAAWTGVTTWNFTAGDPGDSWTAYAGLAPMPRQAGASVWPRPALGQSGKGRLRTA